MGDQDAHLEQREFPLMADQNQRELHPAAIPVQEGLFHGEGDSTLRDYTMPRFEQNMSSIHRPTIAKNSFEIKTSVIQMISTTCMFNGLASDDPNFTFRTSTKYVTPSRQPLDIRVLKKMEIHKCGNDESKKEAMGFPSLITYFCINAGIDLSAEEIKELPIDIRINQWYSFYPSRGLRRPRGPKRTRIEAEDSESDAEGSEPKAGDVEDVKDVEEDDNVEDGLMQDFTELRIELKVFPYSRPKKAHPFPLSHIPPIGGPAISEEAAQINIATERSLKELADREAAVRDPSSKGKGKLPRTS
ncbi:hypothetical protein LWI28_002638 [Acer negundo]|uniref:Uncharacterized protein n=1 Tax=Acer negundo TaxID=4023 RepID=A0AAD5JCG7_ACENE|nr:hypothetical protein LWI28_002638 [Acer negundo]